MRGDIKVALFSSYDSRRKELVASVDFALSRAAAHTSSVATTIRSFRLEKLSNAGRTSSEKTGEPSGSGGAE